MSKRVQIISRSPAAVPTTLPFTIEVQAPVEASGGDDPPDETRTYLLPHIKKEIEDAPAGRPIRIELERHAQLEESLLIEAVESAIAQDRAVTIVVADG